MIVIDASVLIALYRQNDEGHVRATELIQNLDEPSIITLTTLSEVLTFIKRKDGGRRVKEIWDNMKTSDIRIIEILDFLENIVYFVEKYEDLSFGDATSIALMKEFGITKIISFDSDFDLIPGIERIH